MINNELKIKATNLGGVNFVTVIIYVKLEIHFGFGQTVRTTTHMVNKIPKIWYKEYKYVEVTPSNFFQNS